jgi:glycolate oxidase iron-sulfur subunit
MAGAIGRCVHCGFCLPVCPTYKVMGEEMDSPRGRIFLMKEALEGGLALDETLPYIDRCLGCQACVPACPSGVPYGELLVAFRAHSSQRRQLAPLGRLVSLLLWQSLPFPWTFRLGASMAKMLKPFQGLLPAQLQAMLSLLPAELSGQKPLPAGIYRPQGPPRARVALLAGCVQQVIAPEINWATARVLVRNGVEVLVPNYQQCCGALSMHAGMAAQARALARHNLRVFPKDVEAIIANTAGCGSGMKEYPLLFKGLPEEKAARQFAAKVKDVASFLDELGLTPPAPLRRLKVAYHDPCHLAQAQGIKDAPRRLLRTIPNLTLLELAEPDLCCGSAGTYNIEQPELAQQLGERKANTIRAAGAEAVVTGNIGCITQLRLYLGPSVPIYHTIELLDRAYSRHQ